MKMISKYGYPLSAFVFLFLALSCGSSTKEEKAVPELLQVIPVVSKNVTTFRSFNTVLQGENEIDIRSRVEGTITAVYVKEGAYVRRGEKLFQIDQRPYLAILQQANGSFLQAQGAFEKATIEKDRVERLSKNSVVSEIQLKTAKAEYNQAQGSFNRAKALVDGANLDLSYTTITAPADGYLGNFPYRIGSLIDDNNSVTLTRLSSTTAMNAYFSMSEKDLGEFNKSYSGLTQQDILKNVPPLELLLSDGNIFKEKGKLENRAGQFDPQSGLVTFRAIFSNKNGMLQSGSYAKVRFASYQKSVLLIPQKATFELQDKIFVFVLLKDNTVQRRAIETGQVITNYYIVSSGLSAGEKIVLTGVGRLKDGAEINPQYQSFESLLKTTPLVDLIISDQ
jgi:membrane fusion protein (multidrug efflux system)